MVSSTSIDSENRLFELAERFISETSRCLFLTGKAGTGKTTFLKIIKENVRKNAVVVAPTGVAAINAAGTTIHSFFQLPFSPFVPQTPSSDSQQAWTDEFSLIQNLRIESEKRNIFLELELLIIDEVSMVRCDVLDSIDIVLRHYRGKRRVAFGGVQVLFIGDLYQLPPVVQPSEWSILGQFYRSPFFFDAHVMKEARPLYIELKKIYRQSDPLFIDLLNRVRNNKVEEEDINTLNRNLIPDIYTEQEDGYVTLTTHNYKADKINSEELEKLPGDVIKFEGIVEGDFPERAYPTEKTLLLKVGAQIMFLKNDMERIRRYFNGKIGTISRIEEGRIFVTFPNQEGELEVEKDTWRNVRYMFNAGTRHIEEEEIGTFTQYGIRLAWAITIHKSQGLTFTKAIIDAGSSFAPGQVYVALSRCTSLEGIILKSKLLRSSIKTDERIMQYSQTELTEDALEPVLQFEQKHFLLQNILKVFDWSIVREELNEFRRVVETSKRLDKQPIVALLDDLEPLISEQEGVIDRFAAQLTSLLHQKMYSSVKDRVELGVRYFIQLCREQIQVPLEEYKMELKGQKRVKKISKALDALISSIKSFQNIMQRASSLSEKLASKDATSATAKEN